MKFLSFLMTLVFLTPLAFGKTSGPQKTMPLKDAAKPVEKSKDKANPLMTGTLYGSTIKAGDHKFVSIAEAVKKFQPENEKDLFVTGKVSKVCKTKGCWLSLSSGPTTVRTLFKDYGFFVPKELVGKKVKVFGKLVSKEISAAKARHYLKDDGATMKELNKVRKPQRVFEFVAAGVKVI